MNMKEAVRILNETKLCSPLGQAAFVAIEAINELVAYREMGTLEQITARIQNGESAIDTNKRLTERIIPMCEELNELDHELNAYREIGTVDEFRALKEKEFKHQVRGMHIEFIDLMQQSIETITKMYVPKPEEPEGGDGE